MSSKKINFSTKIKLIIISILTIFAIYYIIKININSKPTLQNIDSITVENPNQNNLKNNQKTVITKDDKQSKKAPTAEEKFEKNLLENFSSDIVFGNPNAPVTIIEYSSFTCSYCIQMHNNIMDKLTKEYIDTNKVKLVHRAMVNQRTIFSKMLQHCVNQKYLSEITTDLFNTSDEWAYSENILDQLQILASKYEMTKDDFNRCIQDKELGQNIINDQIKASRILKINSTPTLFINKERFVGSRSYKEIKKIINKKLSEIK